MKATEFAYWLQGAFENGAFKDGATAEQLEVVQRHLNMVFIHDIDPSYPANQQAALHVAHSEPKPKLSSKFQKPDDDDIRYRC